MNSLKRVIFMQCHRLNIHVYINCRVVSKSPPESVCSKPSSQWGEIARSKIPAQGWQERLTVAHKLEIASQYLPEKLLCCGLVFKTFRNII